MIFTGGRIAAVAIGLPLLLGTAALGAFDFAGLLAHTSEHHAASYVWHGGEISLDTNSGSVRVEAGTGRQIEVAYTEHYQLKKPTVSATTSGGGLQLVAKCPGGVFSNDCSINYTITVPASAELNLHTGDGGVHLTGTTGTAAVDTGDGGVDLDDVSGTITAHTGDGGIQGTEVRSAVLTASTGDGGVNIRWVIAPTTVVATTGDGGIDLVVPGGSGPYRMSTHTGDGGVNVTVASDPNASSSITASTGDGGITITPAG